MQDLYIICGTELAITASVNIECMQMYGTLISTLITFITMVQVGYIGIYTASGPSDLGV